MIGFSQTQAQGSSKIANNVPILFHFIGYNPDDSLVHKS